MAPFGKITSGQFDLKIFSRIFKNYAAVYIEYTLPLVTGLEKWNLKIYLMPKRLISPLRVQVSTTCGLCLIHSRSSSVAL